MARPPGRDGSRCAATTWKEWWAGTGLNRRHQDFQSTEFRVKVTPSQHVVIVNRDAHLGQYAVVVNPDSDRCRRIIQAEYGSSQPLGGPSTEHLGRMLDKPVDLFVEARDSESLWVHCADDLGDAGRHINSGLDCRQHRRRNGVQDADSDRDGLSVLFAHSEPKGDPAWFGCPPREIVSS